MAEQSDGLSGLSPRERGNHTERAAMVSPERSIPARAGEPLTPNTTSPTVEVYPRASGGTMSDAVYATVAQGLSPRERGNRQHH